MQGMPLPRIQGTILKLKRRAEQQELHAATTQITQDPKARPKNRKKRTYRQNHVRYSIPDVSADPHEGVEVHG